MIKVIAQTECGQHSISSEKKLLIVGNASFFAFSIQPWRSDAERWEFTHFLLDQQQKKHTAVTTPSIESTGATGLAGIN